jgi:nitroreductase
MTCGFMGIPRVFARCSAFAWKIPEWEQVLSAGAAAMNLVHAAHALGYRANWITEWYAYDRSVLDALGLAPHERIAGFIHIGRPPGPPEDRPRPLLNEIVTRSKGLRPGSRNRPPQRTQCFPSVTANEEHV